MPRGRRSRSRRSSTSSDTDASSDEPSDFQKFMRSVVKTAKQTPEVVAVPPFNPSRSAGYTAEAWCKQLEKLQRTHGWTDTELLGRAECNLLGDAKTWWETWTPDNREWKGFRISLTHTFPSVRNYLHEIRDIVNNTTRQNQTLASYARNKHNLLSRLEWDIPEKTIVGIVIDLIDEQRVRDSLHACKPGSMAKLYEHLSRFDVELTTGSKRRHKSRSPEPTTSKHHARDRSDASPGPTPSKRQARDPKQKTFKCFHCGILGHKRHECRKLKQEIASSKRNEPPAITCHFCKKPGHVEANCFQKERAPNKKIHAFSKPDRKNDDIIIIKNEMFSCLLDTGGDCSLISDQAARCCNLTRTQHRLELSGLGGCKVISTETVKTLVSLRTVDFVCTLHVVGNNDMPTDVLIGRDVIDHGLAFTYDAEGLKVVRAKYAENFFQSNQTTVLAFRRQDIQTGLTGADRSRLLDLLDDFEKNITTGNQLPAVNNAELSIKLKRDATFFYRPYRMSIAERKKVRKIVEDLLKNRIIQPSNSQYASPTLLVRKNETDDRMCHDFRRLNELTIKDRYPIPRIDDQLDRLGKGVFFTSLDMASGFYQVPIAKDSRDKTSFVTPDGQYEYLRMPFGLANAPAVFQRAINNALGNLRYTIAIVYLDDVLIPSETIDEGLRNLKIVLQALTGAGFSLNYKKCRFLETKIEYLGREISASGIRPTDKKIQALTQSPVPTCVKQVRQFVGLANYFRRFILAFAILISPITALMKKDSVWNWTSECELARIKIITILTSKPVIRIFDHEKPTELHTDASSIGVAAILMQWDGENRVVVAYFSKKNSAEESKRHSFELETLAVVTAVKHFRCYLLGIKFKIVTDCDAVKSTMVKRHINGKVARWWTYLQDFEFEIEYRAGKKLAHVDYLSRNPIMIMKKNCIPWLVAEQAKEDEVRKIIRELGEGQNAELRKLFTVKDGMLYRRITTPGGKETLLWYVPSTDRLRICRAYHDDLSHVSGDKGYEVASKTYWFPRMRHTIVKYARRCLNCTLGKANTGKTAVKLAQRERAKTPFHTVYLDFLGPLTTINGQKHALILVDEFTKFCILKSTSAADAVNALAMLELQTSLFGAAKVVYADRAKAFDSNIISDYCKTTGTTVHLTTTGNHRGIGSVERMIRSIHEKLVTIQTDWTKELSKIQHASNITKASATGFTPLELLTGRTDVPRTDAVAEAVSIVSDESLDEKRRLAVERSESYARKYIEKWNEKHRPAIVFNVSDLVCIKSNNTQGKLGKAYDGPFKIIGVLNNHRYELHNLQTGRKVIRSSDQMRRWPTQSEQTAHVGKL